jgi:heavy metal translocating P-type ATPase
MGLRAKIKMTESETEQTATAEAMADCQPCEPGHGDGSSLSAFGFRIGISLALAGQGMIFGLGYNNALQAGEAPEPGTVIYWALHGGLILSALAVAFILGRPLLRQTAEALSEKRLSVEALFVLSGFGAFAGSLISSIRGSGSVYYEVVSIVLCVYAIGKQIGVIQKGRVGDAIASLRHAFDSAIVEGGNGQRTVKPVTALQPTDRVLVHPGDPIPVDGRLLSGSGYVRETALSGEPAPVSKAAGDTVMAGTWSLDGNFVIEPDLSGARTIDRILGLLESASGRQSNLQASADRLMQVFVPLVALVSAGTFAGWLWLSEAPWWDGLFNAMAVLLVACPCALGLAMPAGIWGGLYHLSRRGVTGRNGHLLDTLADCRTIIFDKTGTLSQFDLEVDTRQLEPSGIDLDWLLGAIASIGRESHHPVSTTLAHVSPRQLPVTGLHVHPGQGISGFVEGRGLLLGEESLLGKAGIQLPGTSVRPGKPVHVAVDGTFAGTVYLSEELRPEAEATLEALAALGCRCHILSGDPSPATPTIGGIPVLGGLDPVDKAAWMRDAVPAGERTLFVGDGINDLPAMQVADSALAIDLGAALATEFADGLLVGGRVASLPGAIRHARRLKTSLQGNLRFALLYNCIGMGLAAAGMLHPVVAALLMVGSSAVVSFRALKVAGSAG